MRQDTYQAREDEMKLKEEEECRTESSVYERAGLSVEEEIH